MNAGAESSRTSPEPLDEMAAALLTVLDGGLNDDFGELLDPSVTWGVCAGREAVVEFVAAMAGEDAGIRHPQVTVSGDRIVTAFTIGDDGPRVCQAIFVRSGLIGEIIDAPDVDGARLVRPVGDLTDAAARPWYAQRSSPVLPVSDVGRAADHYRRLGFDVRAYEGPAAYAFAERNGVEVHLAQFADVDPLSNTSAFYLYVDDADALYAAWRLAEVEGRLIAPVDTDYGLREGAHIDPDGNLIRFGSTDYER